MNDVRKRISKRRSTLLAQDEMHRAATMARSGSQDSFRSAGQALAPNSEFDFLPQPQRYRIAPQTITQRIAAPPR